MKTFKEFIKKKFTEASQADRTMVNLYLQQREPIPQHLHQAAVEMGIDPATGQPTQQPVAAQPTGKLMGTKPGSLRQSEKPQEKSTFVSAYGRHGAHGRERKGGLGWWGRDPE